MADGYQFGFTLNVARFTRSELNTCLQFYHVLAVAKNPVTECTVFHSIVCSQDEEGRDEADRVDARREKGREFQECMYSIWH